MAGAQPAVEFTEHAVVLHVQAEEPRLGVIQLLPAPVEIAGQRIPRLSRTFADVTPGELVAYVGSSGHLEVAVCEGNAAEMLGVGVGAPIHAREVA